MDKEPSFGYSEEHFVDMLEKCLLGILASFDIFPFGSDPTSFHTVQCCFQPRKMTTIHAVENLSVHNVGISAT